MNEVVNSVYGVSSLMSDISAANNDQRSSVQSIGEALTQMDDVTQQSSALVEHAAAASDSLKEQAKELQILMSRFKVQRSDFCTVKNAV